jgi:biotin synthase-related radical SAM superfamily protein
LRNTAQPIRAILLIRATTALLKTHSALNQLFQRLSRSSRLLIQSNIALPPLLNELVGIMAKTQPVHHLSRVCECEIRHLKL